MTSAPATDFDTSVNSASQHLVASSELRDDLLEPIRFDDHPAVDRARALMNRLDDPAVADLVARTEFPQDLFQMFAEHGLMRIGIAQEWGGEPAGIVTKMRVAEVLSQRLSVLTWVWGITGCFAAPLLSTLADPHLQAEILPRVARGEIRFAFGVSEPSGGSDLFGALHTRLLADPTGGSPGVLEGVKRWCTGSASADYLFILARDHDADAGGTDGLVLCLVDRHEKGMTFDRIPTPSFASAVGTYEVAFNHVRVLHAWRGPEVKRALRRVLIEERLLICGIASGAAMGAVGRALGYAAQRHAFGQPVDSYQGLQHRMADAVMDLEVARHYGFDMGHRWDDGEEVEIGCDVAKSRTTRSALEAADAAIQLMGGIGCTRWGGVEHVWRDLRTFQVAPISEELVRNRVARTLGMGAPR